MSVMLIGAPLTPPGVRFSPHHVRGKLYWAVRQAYHNSSSHQLWRMLTQGQKKLSQNKTETERQRIIEHLEKSENTSEKDIANYIRNL